MAESGPCVYKFDGTGEGPQEPWAAGGSRGSGVPMETEAAQQRVPLPQTLLRMTWR